MWLLCCYNCPNLLFSLEGKKNDGIEKIESQNVMRLHEMDTKAFRSNSTRVVFANLKDAMSKNNSIPLITINIQVYSWIWVNAILYLIVLNCISCIKNILFNKVMDSETKVNIRRESLSYKVFKIWSHLTCHLQIISRPTYLCKWKLVSLSTPEIYLSMGSLEQICKSWFNESLKSIFYIKNKQYP